jgi:hypothetical protein
MDARKRDIIGDKVLDCLDNRTLARLYRVSEPEASDVEWHVLFTAPSLYDLRGRKALEVEGCHEALLQRCELAVADDGNRSAVSAAVDKRYFLDAG